MDTSPIPLLSPEVSFRHDRVPPPAFTYVTKDDYLAVSVYTTAATTGLKLSYRYLDTGGHVHHGTESLDGASTSTLTTKIFSLSEGYLLGLAISNLGGGLADQVCWVVAGLQRSGQASTAPHTILAQGYVSNIISVNWPPSLARGPATSDAFASWPGLATNPDRPPSSPNAMDDEFDAATLNAKWTWLDQGTATATFAASHLLLTLPAESTGTYKLRGIGQPTPTPPYEFTARIDPPPAIASAVGTGIALALYETSSGKVVILESASTAGSGPIPSCLIQNWTSLTAPGGTVGVSVYVPTAPGHYLRIGRTGTTLAVSFSSDGVAWQAMASLAMGTYFTTAPDTVALLALHTGTGAANIVLASDWFRRTA